MNRRTLLKALSFPAIVAAGAFSWMTAAYATGSLDCTAEDEAVRFDFVSTISRNASRGMISFEAQIEIYLENAPDSMKLVKFGDEDLAHHWYHDRDVKLLLYKERGEGLDGAVELVIEAREQSSGTYEGHYRLTIYSFGEKEKSKSDDIKAHGRASCSSG